MTFGEACSFFLSFYLILMSSLIFYILVKYYDSINFTQRNTVTYLSLNLINICYINIFSLVILQAKERLKNVAGAANHFTAYWLWGPYNCSYGAEILHRHVFYVFWPFLKIESYRITLSSSKCWWSLKVIKWDVLILSRSNFLDYHPKTIFPIILD